MKRVLVTGASGFIGRATIPILKQRGFEVHSLGRKRLPGGDFFFHEIDLLKPDNLSGILKAVQPHVLLHLAWNAEPGSYWTSAANLDWVDSSLHLLRCFAEAGGTRAVIAGTCAEYEWSESPLHETESVCRPSTLYGASKDNLRRLSEAYAKNEGLSLAWGRVFYLYGPAEKERRLVSGAILALLAGKRFSATSGSQKRDFLHVADVAGAFVALLESDTTGAVNIGSGDAVTVRDVLNLIGSLTGRGELLDLGQKPLSLDEPKMIVADVGRLKHEVGFTPRHSLASGISETIEWWKINGRAMG